MKPYRATDSSSCMTTVCEVHDNRGFAQHHIMGQTASVQKCAQQSEEISMERRRTACSDCTCKRPGNSWPLRG